MTDTTPPELPDTEPMKLDLRKKRHLTIKQKKWLKEYVKSGNATDAAMKAYNLKSKEVAGNIGYENVKKMDYQELMELMGISDQKLLSTLDNGLDAYSTDKFGKVRKDFSTIHKYLETGLKLKKRLDAKQSEPNNNLIGLSIVVNNKV